MELRIQRHHEVRALIQANQLTEAMQLVDRTVDELGPHVGILCERAGCLFELGLFQQCWDLVHDIDRQFSEVLPKLSPNSAARTAVMLAKFFEEMAHPARAIELLKQAERYDVELNLRKAIISNELRILAYFGIKNELQKKYALVCEGSALYQNLKIELLHGLMWAEWSLFGFQHALGRWSAIQCLSMNELDRRLIARDFIEISLFSNQSLTPEFKTAVGQLRSTETLKFDQELLNLAGFKLSTPPAVDEMSDMARLRLLSLHIQLQTDEEMRREAKIRYQFLTDALSKESRAMFKRIEPQMESTSSVELVVFASERRLMVRASNVTFPITQNQLRFLTLFFDCAKSFTLDEISEALWSCPSSESIYHRVRMLVYKLNEEISSRTGSQPFEVKQDGVRLLEVFRISPFAPKSRA